VRANTTIGAGDARADAAAAADDDDDVDDDDAGRVLRFLEALRVAVAVSVDFSVRLVASSSSCLVSSPPPTSPPSPTVVSAVNDGDDDDDDDEEVFSFCFEEEEDVSVGPVFDAGDATAAAAGASGLLAPQPMHKQISVQMPVPAACAYYILPPAFTGTELSGSRSPVGLYCSGLRSRGVLSVYFGAFF